MISKSGVFCDAFNVLSLCTFQNNGESPGSSNTASCCHQTCKKFQTLPANRKFFCFRGLFLGQGQAKNVFHFSFCFRGLFLATRTGKERFPKRLYVQHFHPQIIYHKQGNSNIFINFPSPDSSANVWHKLINKTSNGKCKC